MLHGLCHCVGRFPDQCVITPDSNGHVEIPASLTQRNLHLGFHDCSNLISVSFESDSQIRTIGPSTFEGSGIKSITLPASITHIKRSAFMDCSKLTSVSFESGSQLIMIDDYAFANSGLVSINIPASVTSIGQKSFWRCSRLTSVSFESGSRIKTIGKSAFYNSGLSGSITLPASVTSIGSNALSGCPSLTSLIFESGSQLTTIGYWAFSGSNLKSITIPASVTSIEKCAFIGSNSLTSVTFESGSQLTTIGEFAFQSTGLTGSIILPASVTSIEKSAFSYCPKLLSIILPASLISIGDYAFKSSFRLTSVIIKSGSQLTTISNNAFNDVSINECVYDDALYSEDFTQFINQQKGFEICSKNINVQCSIDEIYSRDNSQCLTCPSKNACITGHTCEVGYEGEGCAQCSNDYFFLKNRCNKCPQTNIILLLTVGLIFTAIFGVFLYYLSKYLIDFAGISTISISHFQTISIFISMKLPIPIVFYNIINYIQAFFSMMFIDLLFSPECVTTTFDFYDKWLIMTFIPVIILFIMFIFEKCRFGRTVNVGISIFYIYLLNQAFKMWNCEKLDNDTYVLKSNPSIICFDHDINPRWTYYAVIAFFLALIMFPLVPIVFGYMINKEILNADNPSFVNSCDFLYKKYKEKNIYWELNVEMPRKWLIVFFSTFMPTSDWQAGMEITIICVYWVIHAICLPYRTDWKDSKNEPVSPHLENNLQHFMYAIQLSLIVGMLISDGNKDNTNTEAIVLLIIYFLGIAGLNYCIIRTIYRQYSRKSKDDNNDMGCKSMCILTITEEISDISQI